MSISNFSHTHFVRQKEFRNILTKVRKCFDIMSSDISNTGQLLRNDENEMRDKLHYDYLNNKNIRSQVRLNGYLFNPETPSDEKQGNKRGRTDFKVIIKSRTFDNPQEFFTIECKRIDGSTALNREYVINGIQRFIDNAQPLYQSYCRTNGLIGFIVNNADIVNNVAAINKYLLSNSQCNTNTVLNREKGVEDCFKSLHTSEKLPLQLYHLMLDFSSLIN